MAILTSGQLKERFRLSKLQRQQEKEEKKRQRQLQYKELVKQADLLLKKAEEEAKKQKMEELYKLAEKASPERNKLPHMPYISPKYICEPFDLYTSYYTREELQAIEREEGMNYINWDKWDRVVQATKDKLFKEGYKLEASEQDKKHNDRNKGQYQAKKTFAYDLNGELINTFSSILKAAQFYHISTCGVKHSIKKCQPVKKIQIYFRNQ